MDGLNIFDFMKENTQWMFSGIGVLVLGAFMRFSSRQFQLGRELIQGKKLVVVDHDTFPITEIKEKVRFARHQVLILDSWLARPDALPEVLKDAASRNVHIKILVLGGEGADIILQQRMQDLDSKIRYPSDFSDQVVKQINEWPDKLRSKIYIHSFCAQPPFVMYLIDDCVYLGLFWHTKISTMGPFLQINEPSKVFDHIVETFNKIWEDNSVEYKLKSYQ